MRMRGWIRRTLKWDSDGFFGLDGLGTSRVLLISKVRKKEKNL